MLKQRVLTASVLAPLAVAGIFFLPLSYFILLISSIALFGHWEWRRFLPITSSRFAVVIIPSLLLIGSVLVLPVTQDGLDFSVFGEASTLVIAGSVWWLWVLVMVLKYPKGTAWWANNGGFQQLFAVLTLLPFLWSVILLRAYHYDIDPYMGAKLVLLVCLLVWAADTGAYFAGKRFGKRKMAPFVSPNKTVEGLVGGLISAIAVTMIAAHAFSIPFSSAFVLSLVALITSFACVLGDLLESMFKRVAGVKDSGSILPGHGGILDRIDSLTAAFPVFTVLYFGLAQ